METVFNKNSLKWYILISVIIIIGLIVLRGDGGVSDKEDTNVISNNFIDFNNDSYKENLIVKMIDGKYYEDKNPGAKIGGNFDGKFNIELTDNEGNIISKFDLNEAFNEQKLSFQNFNVEFDDYNNDGNIDFTIGQYVSSNGSIYKLFTILPDGKIEELPIKGQSDIFSSGGNRYSKKFEKIDDTAFKNQYYDNSKGQTFETYYSWVDKEFIRSTIMYTNTKYGFSFFLPDSWEGYSIVNDEWEGFSIEGQETVQSGPLLRIRHPKYTSQNPRQDIPIMVFTTEQWELLQDEKFHIGAAPINPSELGRNSEYVFALPARYNYAFIEGYEEVDSIINSNPLHTVQ